MANIDLCSLDSIKDYGELKGSTSIIDDVIEDLISRVTEIFHNYCNIDQFKNKEYTEYYDGDGTNLLFPYNIPIISITDIYTDSDWVFGSDTTVASTEYTIVNSDYIVLKNTVFPSNDQNIKIIYSAGYETIPNDLVQICIEEVLRKHKHRADFDLISKSLKDGSVSYTEKGLLTSTKTVLDKYKKLVIY